jgi:hypothetical protein
MGSERITESLEAAIKDPSLQDSVAALSEVVLDAALESGTLREIPLVGSIIGLGRAAVAFRDRLFLNKLRYFLSEIESVSADERRQVIESINASQETEIKVGEKILYIVDRCEDRRKASLAGKLFKRMLEGLLDYADFMALSAILDRLSVAEVLEFVDSTWETSSIEEFPYVVGTSLVTIWQETIEVSNQDDWKKASQPYVVRGGELKVEVSPLGRELRAALGSAATDPI